jgi:hypothetical protein
VFRRDGITHLACVHIGGKDGGETMKFQDKDVGVSFLLFWSASHNKYRYVHCESCAQCVWGWFCAMQEEWGMPNAFGGAIQKAGQTYH